MFQRQLLQERSSAIPSKTFPPVNTGEVFVLFMPPNVFFSVVETREITNSRGLLWVDESGIIPFSVQRGHRGYSGKPSGIPRRYSLFHRTPLVWRQTAACSRKSIFPSWWKRGTLIGS